VKREIEERCAPYISTLNFDKHDFLTNLVLFSSEEITQKANMLQEYYNDDLEKHSLVNVFIFEHIFKV